MLGAFRLNTIGNSSSAAIGWLLYNTGARASNITPGGFDVDSTGNIYILDMYSSKLAKISPTGSIIWQKYVSSPSTTTSKGDGNLLCLSPDGNYLYCHLLESATSLSLCQFLTSDGSLNTKQVTSVTTGNVYPGSIHTSTVSTHSVIGVTSSTTNRMLYRRYTGGNSALSTANATIYHLAAGATAINDCRISAQSPYLTSTNIMYAYENYVGTISGSTLNSTKSFTGGFDSIASSQVTSGAGFIMRDNIIAKFSSLSLPTKSWEKTHTISSVGGSHYYQQGMITDSLDNVYACYWNSTAGKIVIYKLDTNGNHQWTKSLSLNGATSVDAMMLKLSGTDLYLAFRYGPINAGGMAILKIPASGSGTKTFTNNFILATETGTLTSSSNFSLTANSPVTTSTTIGTTGSAFTLSNSTLPSNTQETF